MSTGRKTLAKCVSSLVGVSLIVGLVGSFALASENKLTPYEFLKLSAKDKMNYRTVIIRPRLGWGRVWGKDKKEEIAKKFDELLATCDLQTPLDWYSTTLFYLKHPEVKFEEGAHISGDIQAAMTAFASGEAVTDFYMGSGGGPPAFKELGVLADITDLVKDWDQTSALWERAPAAWEKCWIDGRCYGLLEGSGYTMDMALRKEWFKEAGIFDEKGQPRPSFNWSWNNLRDIALKLTDTKKKRWGLGFTPHCLETWGSNIPMWITLSFGNFEPWTFAVPDKTGKYTWRFGVTPPLVEALQYIKDMRWKDNSMLTDITYKYWDSYFKDFMGGRVGIAAIWYPCGDYLGQSPWNPDRKFIDDLGLAPLPAGEKTGIRMGTFMSNPMGFLSTMTDEELRLAFDLVDWNMCGTGAMLKMERVNHKYSIMGVYPGFLGDIRGYVDSPYKPRFELPTNLKKAFEELYPKELIELFNFDRKVPHEPNPDAYGLKLSWDGIPAEFPYIASVYQKIVSDPNADVVTELRKIEDAVNTECFSFKIEDDKEKFKKYYTAKAEWYKKHYPKFYESDLFKQLWEEYYKVW